MNEASQTSVQMTFPMESVTSLQESADGTTLCNSPVGHQTCRSGQVHARASRSVVRGNIVAPQTNATSGRFGFASFSSDDLSSYSENKSPQRQLLDGDLITKTRVCKKCGIEKLYSEFYINSKGGRRWTCSECCRIKSRIDKRSNPDVPKKQFKNWRLANRGAALVTIARYRAKKRGMDFNLTAQDIQERIAKGYCELTGIEFDLKTPRAWNAPSLDRIDSKRGYTTDNVRVVLYSVNVMANTWGIGKITEIASAISKARMKESDLFSDRLARNLQNKLATVGSMEFSQTWKEKVTPAGRLYWEHTALGRRTDGNGVGAPHRRQRCYWGAYAKGAEFQRAIHKEGRTVGCGEIGIEFLADTTSGRFGISGDCKPCADHDAHIPRLEGRHQCNGRAGEWIAWTTGAWSDFDILPYRDGKARRIESGVFPLVAGLPKGMVYSGNPGAPCNENATAEARIMRLKGYGNSIVPQLAAEFVRAFMTETWFQKD